MSRKLGWEAARDYLRKMREDQVRDGEAAVQLWEEVLRDNAHKLGDEMWTVLEQVAVAAVDCQKFDVSEDCIKSLRRKFPKSHRVYRLMGMWNEAIGEYDTAKEIYKKVLDEDETNMFVRKREIAIEKAQNNIQKAIELLAEYLKSFMTDFDAWLELCDLYLQQQDYKKAAFCMEELIMSNPNNHLFYQKYAEIKYTEGGQENLELARAYFAQAAKLNPNNMRAQFGLLLTASNLATAYSQKSQKDRHSNSKYAAWAAKQITDKYQTELSPEQVKEMKVLDFLNKILESVSGSH